MLNFREVRTRTGEDALLVSGTPDPEQDISDMYLRYEGIVLVNTGMASCDIAAYFTQASCVATEVDGGKGRMFSAYICRSGSKLTYAELLFVE